MSATFTIDHRCGHSAERDLSNKIAGERRRFAKWLSGELCTSCWKKSEDRKDSEEFAAHKAAKLEEARADQERFGLPILTGSDGQIKWGLTSRHALLRAAYAEQVEAGEMSEDEFDQQILEPAKQIDFAGWWIDNRESSTEELIGLVNDPGERASSGGNENPY